MTFNLAWVAQATDELRHAHHRRDSVSALKLHDLAQTAGLNPRRALEGANPGERGVLKSWFEAWDDVLRGWWLGPKPHRGDAWRHLLLPTCEGFAFPLLLMNAWWLRESGSARMDQPSPPPGANSPGKSVGGKQNRTKRLEQQATALGRFCLSCDAATPIDYAEIATHLEPKLRPLLAHWFLSTYLWSPFTALDDAVNRNRDRAAAEFAAYHEQHPVNLPYSPLYCSTGYRACYFSKDPEPFIRVLANRILNPSLAALGAVGSRTTVELPKSDRVGVYLSLWNEGHAVQRCIDPMLDRLRQEGVYAYYDGDPGRVGTFPAHWRSGGVEWVHVGRCASGAEVAAAARRIRKDNLDLLFYPEVGLTLATRALSTLRLARVQAAGYGHPATTGSNAIDYFVCGAAVETKAAPYHEQVVLVPGLGVSTTEPLHPSTARAEASHTNHIAVVNMSSFDKLNAQLVGAWDTILQQAGSGVRLHLFPAVPHDHLGPLVERLGPLLPHGESSISGSVPRQDCVDLLSNADVYLDSFPFGGYNTVIEALTCGCPVVTLEGQQAFGRFGAAVLRLLELPDFLIARTVEDYESAALRLIKDPKLRGEIRAQLSRERVMKVLHEQRAAQHFATAIQRMRDAGPHARNQPAQQALTVTSCAASSQSSPHFER